MKRVMSIVYFMLFVVCVGVSPVWAFDTNNVRLQMYSDINRIRAKFNVLEKCEYRTAISELEKQSVAYILTEQISSNSQNSKKAVLLVNGAKAVAGIDVINCADYKCFLEDVSNLIKQAKSFSESLISGIDIVADARPSLPHSYTRITISNGKEKVIIYLYEVHYIWAKKYSNCSDERIIKINKFLSEYVDIIEIVKGWKALDCFSVPLYFK